MLPSDWLGCDILLHVRVQHGMACNVAKPSVSRCKESPGKTFTIKSRISQTIYKIYEFDVFLDVPMAALNNTNKNRTNTSTTCPGATICETSVSIYATNMEKNTKSMPKGYQVRSHVFVYPLLIQEHRLDWPERDERSCRWAALDEAVELVGDRGLSRLLKNLSRSRGDLLRDICMSRQPAKHG